VSFVHHFAWAIRGGQLHTTYAVATDHSDFWERMRIVAARAPKDPAMRGGINLNPHNFQTARPCTCATCKPAV
jgi:hypothetical protein